MILEWPCSPWKCWGVPLLSQFSTEKTCGPREYMWGPMQASPQLLYLASDSTNWETCLVTSTLSLGFSSTKGSGARIVGRVQCGEIRDSGRHLLWGDFTCLAMSYTTLKPPPAGSIWALGPRLKEPTIPTLCSKNNSLTTCQLLKEVAFLHEKES